MAASVYIPGWGELVVITFIGFLLLFGTPFWIWMLVECATREPNDRNDKVVWVIVICLAHTIGALIYFFVRRPRRIAETGR